MPDAPGLVFIRFAYIRLGSYRHVAPPRLQDRGRGRRSRRSVASREAVDLERARSD
jgi:hypothetical protein